MKKKHYILSSYPPPFSKLPHPPPPPHLHPFVRHIIPELLDPQRRIQAVLRYLINRHCDRSIPHSVHHPLANGGGGGVGFVGFNGDDIVGRELVGGEEFALVGFKDEEGFSEEA